jgi:predicted Fe-S protein YdhL (DUF1289 family)
MDINPMDNVEAQDSAASQAASKLNTWVAITVALLATFTGICQIKDNNICQGMQQAQADKIDHWAFYQARNLREEVAKATSEELRLSVPATNASGNPALTEAIQKYDALAAEQALKKTDLMKQAQDDQSTYDALNYRDDQFDLSDALVALAISLLALTALTQKKWLYLLALAPTGLGVFMGLAGLLGWQIHPDAIVKLLT